MKSKYLKLILVLIVMMILTASAIYLLHKKEETSKIHYHAGFAVFKDNKQADFTDFKYMVVKPCTTDKKEEKESDEDEQIEKAHLHDEVGDVVHVEKKDSRWADLFTNLKYDIDYPNAIAYLNGKKVDNFQGLVIQPYDSLVVLLGSSEYNKVSKKAVTVKHIQEAEKRSENCGS